MNSFPIILRTQNQRSMTFAVPDSNGQYTPIPVEPEAIERLYESLYDALPPIYALFEGHTPGEMTADIPYPTPVGMLSDRVPAVIRDTLREAVSSNGGVPQTLLISETDPFPWELVRPEPESMMLGQDFNLARFDGDCRFAVAEATSIIGLCPVPLGDQCEAYQGTFNAQWTAASSRINDPGKRQLLDCVGATRDALVQAMRTDERHILHYMGHHFHDDHAPERSVLPLAGQDRISPIDVTTEFPDPATESKWPWVFLNCCRALANRHVGDPFEQGPPQWGQALNRAGAWATIGPYWRVEKSESFEPAKLFYRFVLEEGSSLGAALRRIRREHPRPATNLAYTMVGDPTTTVVDSTTAPSG